MSQVEEAQETEVITAPVPSVLAMIDEIVMGDDRKILENVAMIRRYLGGERPSIVIKEAVIRGTEAVSPPPASMIGEGVYGLKDFLNALLAHRGQSYAWRSELISASNSSPGARAIKNEEIQRWQQSGEVPAWAYDQIALLVFKKRKGDAGPAWGDIEYDFLKRLYLGTADKSDGSLYDTSAKTSNSVFASICSEKFGRTITENAIKGAIDRLRKKGILPKKRN